MKSDLCMIFYSTGRSWRYPQRLKPYLLNPVRDFCSNMTRVAAMMISVAIVTEFNAYVTGWFNGHSIMHVIDACDNITEMARMSSNVFICILHVNRELSETYNYE